MLDGSPVLIRSIRPDDKQRLRTHFRGLGPQTVYYRFFEFRRDLTDDELVRFTELDFINHVGLAATVGQGNEERFLGVGRYFRGADGQSAEVAFAVLDEFQGKGIGTLLLKHLAIIARRSGIRVFTALVMASNEQMLEVFAHSGYREHERFDSGLVRVTLEIGPSDDLKQR